MTVGTDQSTVEAKCQGKVLSGLQREHETPGALSLDLQLPGVPKTKFQCVCRQEQELGERESGQAFEMLIKLSERKVESQQQGTGRTQNKL